MVMVIAPGMFCELRFCLETEVLTLVDMIPQEKYALYTGVLSSVSALSSVLGPVLGGFLSSGGPSTWRWVFLLK
jgi:MFS family permease